MHICTARTAYNHQHLIAAAHEAGAWPLPGSTLAAGGMRVGAAPGAAQGSSAELRELAAEGLGEMVTATGDAALKPFVVQITGPLIR